MGIFLNMMPVQKKVQILSDCHTFWTKMLLNKGLKKVRHFPVMWDSPKLQHHISVTIGPIWLKFWPSLYLFLLRPPLKLKSVSKTKGNWAIDCLRHLEKSLRNSPIFTANTSAIFQKEWLVFWIFFFSTQKLFMVSPFIFPKKFFWYHTPVTNYKAVSHYRACLTMQGRAVAQKMVYLFWEKS